MLMTSWGACRCAKMASEFQGCISDVFLTKKPQNKERYNMESVDELLVFLQSVSNTMGCFPGHVT